MGSGRYFPGEMGPAVKFSAHLNILPTLGMGIGGWDIRVLRVFDFA